MGLIEIRDAKAQFSALLEAAELGQPNTITRHGKPAAVLVWVADSKRLYPDDRPSLVDLLLGFPGGLEFERDRTRRRDIDL